MGSSVSGFFHLLAWEVLCQGFFTCWPGKFCGSSHLSTRAGKFCAREFPLLRQQAVEWSGAQGMISFDHPTATASYQRSLKTHFDRLNKRKRWELWEGCDVVEAVGPLCLPSPPLSLSLSLSLSFFLVLLTGLQTFNINK